MSAVTKWFPASVKPVRDGEYEVHRYNVSIPYPSCTRLLWQGGKWLHTADSFPGYQGSSAFMSAKDGDKWRGLAADPSKVSP